MLREELDDLLNKIQIMKCESSILEFKSAKEGRPKKLYDTLSSFSNQDEGGIIIFGIDESNDFAESGVYDAQLLQKAVNEQCLQMEPIIRPVFTITKRNNNLIVSAEIPAVDLADRPCYYKGKGRLKGSYVRVGDSDEPMNEYEIYSFEAFRKKYQDDVRITPRETIHELNADKLQKYLLFLKEGKPNLSNLSDKKILELMNIIREDQPTLVATLIFGLYPQAYYPQYCINAVCVPGNEIGDMGSDEERFIDNKRIEGTISDMLEQGIQFVKSNMKNPTKINPETGASEIISEYPITAIREAILNALVHRDYSIHTEGKPIQLIMYNDRMEIVNPGGVYGRISVDQLGKIQPDTRNPALATILEVLKITENRYSGIPTIRNLFQKQNLPNPVFMDTSGEFKAIFYKRKTAVESVDALQTSLDFRLIQYCKTPRTRKEISTFLGLSSTAYAIKRYVLPLLRKGLLKMENSSTPSSHNQRFYSS